MLIFRLSPIDEFVVKFSIYSCRKSKTMSLVKELTHFLSLFRSHLLSLHILRSAFLLRVSARVCAHNVDERKMEPRNGDGRKVFNFILMVSKHSRNSLALSCALWHCGSFLWFAGSFVFNCVTLSALTPSERECVCLCVCVCEYSELYSEHETMLTYIFAS